MNKKRSFESTVTRITKIGDRELPMPEIIRESYFIDGHQVTKADFENITNAGHDQEYDTANNKRGNIMITTEEKNQIAVLRAQDVSYMKIAEKLNISKPTIIEAVKDMENLILNLRGIEIEALMETLNITHRHRLETLSKMLDKIKTEILSRDLKDIPADKLIELYMKIESNYSTLLTGTSFRYKVEDGEDIWDFSKIKTIST
jgi:predicted DNA-binding protein YlxM (UPF0122 family)